MLDRGKLQHRTTNRGSKRLGRGASRSTRAPRGQRAGPSRRAGARRRATTTWGQRRDQWNIAHSHHDDH
eukprot:704238-Pyramimonas_sp.AAC.1